MIEIPRKLIEVQGKLTDVQRKLIEIRARDTSLLEILKRGSESGKFLDHLNGIDTHP